MTAQHLVALDRANHVSSARVIYKRQLRAEGPARAVELLGDLPPELESMPTARFIAAIHNFGPVRATGICRRAGISEIRRLGELTERQRGVLATALHPKGKAGR